MKRNRAPNFTTAEILLLLRLVEKFPILENKKTDAVTTSDKLQAWRELSDEYNSTTSAVHRTTENLIACYKNQKIKVKKQYSNEKMTLKVLSSSHSATVSLPSTSQCSDIQIVSAVEEMGQDWPRISESMGVSAHDCKTTFENVVRKAKQEDNNFKKEIQRTGGGPPPEPEHNEVFEKVKVLMGPSIDGLYTCYGGDADFMHQQQEQFPQEKKRNPIDEPSTSYITGKADNGISMNQTPVSKNKASFPKRLGLLKHKVDPALNTENTGKKKKSMDTFLELAEDKKEYIGIKKIMADEALEHQRKINTINLEILEEKLKFNKRCNAIELEIKEMDKEFLKQKNELELNLLRNKL